MHGLGRIIDENKAKAVRANIEALKKHEIKMIRLSLDELKQLSDDDDRIDMVEAGTVNGLILAIEQCVAQLEQYILVK